jgi:hypothetical protein
MLLFCYHRFPRRLICILQELIKVNGYQVAPAELEDLLLKSGDVADAAVIGITVYVCITFGLTSPQTDPSSQE